MGTGYREKSPVPSALSPTPQVLGANMLQDTLDAPCRGNRSEGTHSIDENDEEADGGNDPNEDDCIDQEIVDDSNHNEMRETNNDGSDIENPVFGTRNSYSATIKSNFCVTFTGIQLSKIFNFVSYSIFRLLEIGYLKY